MPIKIIMVEPLYQINLGYVARVAKNFGINKINLVKPRCNYKGKEAIKYSKHAVSLLKSAKIYKNIKDAASDCDIIIGTTGMWHKSDDSFFNVYTLNKAKTFIKKGKRIALLIGRDDIGLTKEELTMCDFTIFVPTDKDYSVLNISHALGIILYELTREKLSADAPMDRFYSDKKSIEGLSKLFWKFIKNRSEIRNKKAVLFAFEHVIRRSNPTKKEINAISVALSDKRKTKN